MAIVLRLPKRQVRMAVAVFVVVALGAGVAAQTGQPAPSVPVTPTLDGAVLPVDISVGADFDQAPQTPARQGEQGESQQGEQGESQQGEQGESQQGEQGASQQGEEAQAPPPVAAPEQDLLTPAERAALELVEQMIRDQEGVLMGTGFSYRPGARRDPFMSLVPDASVVALTVRPFGLPGFMINEIDLKAIASAQGRWHAMVLGPNRRAYFLIVGAQLYDGHVMDIRPGEVVFEQVVPDLTGARRTRQVTKRLRTTDGGGEAP